MRWRAVYSDGSCLEYNSDGSENKYTNIDRQHLTQFHLLKDNVSVLVIHLEPSRKLIYRRRVAVHVSGPKAGTQETIYLVGWQENREGINFQVICFVFEDGHIEILDKFRENHKWFYPIVFLPEEKI